MVKYIRNCNNLKKFVLNIEHNNYLNNEGVKLILDMLKSWKENNHPTIKEIYLDFG